MKNKKVMYVVLGVLCFAIVALSVAFAALSATLNINFGTVTQSQQSWDVHFKTESITATAAGTSATGRVCGTVTASGATATVGATTLSKPGDKCTWKLTVQNTGTIDATLDTITPSSATGTGVTCTIGTASMVCGNITYKLTSDAAGTTAFTTGGTLSNTSGEDEMYLVAEYTGAETSSSAVEQSDAKFTLVYNQA